MEMSKLVSKRATFPAYTAKLLMLLKDKTSWKHQSFSRLKEMDLDRNLLLQMAEEGFIAFENCVLMGTYRKAYEATAKRHAAIYGQEYYLDGIPQCDSFIWNHWPLSKEIFDALEPGTGEVPIDISDVFPPKIKLTIWLDPQPYEYARFELAINSVKVKEFLDQYVAAYTKGTMDDDEHFSYEKQKTAILSFLESRNKEGMSMSNLWLMPPNIWPKEEIFKIRFLETVLAMESEGLLVIKDIIDSAKELDQPSMTADDHWNLPLKIKVAVTASHPVETISSASSGQENLVIFHISKEKNGSVLVEHLPSAKKYLLCKPRFNNSQDQLLEFAINVRPGATFTRQEFQKEMKDDCERSFVQIFDDLNFKGDIRKAFLQTAKDSIRISVTTRASDLIAEGTTEEKVLKALRSTAKKPKPSKT